MSWFPETIGSRIATALERLVVLEEHKLGLSRVELPGWKDESSVSYYDREAQVRQQLEAFQALAGIKELEEG